MVGRKKETREVGAYGSGIIEPENKERGLNPVMHARQRYLDVELMIVFSTGPDSIVPSIRSIWGEDPVIDALWFVLAAKEVERAHRSRVQCIHRQRWKCILTSNKARYIHNTYAAGVLSSGGGGATSFPFTLEAADPVPFR